MPVASGLCVTPKNVLDIRFYRPGDCTFDRLGALINSILYSGGSLRATLLCVVDCDFRPLLGSEISLRGTLRYALSGVFRALNDGLVCVLDGLFGAV